MVAGEPVWAVSVRVPKAVAALSPARCAGDVAGLAVNGASPAVVGVVLLKLDGILAVPRPLGVLAELGVVATDPGTFRFGPGVSKLSDFARPSAPTRGEVGVIEAVLFLTAALGVPSFVELAAAWVEDGVIVASGNSSPGLVLVAAWGGFSLSFEAGLPEAPGFRGLAALRSVSSMNCAGTTPREPAAALPVSVGSGASFFSSGAGSSGTRASSAWSLLVSDDSLSRNLANRTIATKHKNEQKTTSPAFVSRVIFSSCSV
jgi:hypothetical protein